MRLVVFRGSQFDADNLPLSVDAAECVPLADWFAQNRQPARITSPTLTEDAVIAKRPAKGRR